MSHASAASVIDVKKLEAELGVPVVETVAVKTGGAESLTAVDRRSGSNALARPRECAPRRAPDVHRDAEPPHGHVGQAAIDAVMRDHNEVHRLLDATLTEPVASISHVDDRPRPRAAASGGWAWPSSRSCCS